MDPGNLLWYPSRPQPLPGWWYPAAPWGALPCPSCPNQPWSRPAWANPAGVLGPRPSHPAGQHAAAGEQWVPNQLDVAFNTMTLNPPNPTCYMDTRATSDMTNTTGYLRSDLLANYTAILEDFTSLVDNEVEKYTTDEFEAGGYKWKLIIYLNGNKSRNGNGNISLYLKVAEESLPHLWSEFNASFRVFLYDWNNDNYYTLHDKQWFHRKKLERGFDQFMPLDKFKDPSNGYLVDNKCIFGAEVYINKENNRGKGERLVMPKHVNRHQHTWEIEAFSSIATKDHHYSSPFDCGGFKWILVMRPKGYEEARGTHISLYLALADDACFSIATKIHAKYTLHIVDYRRCKKWSQTTEFLFDKRSYCYCYGWNKFFPLNILNDPSKGYLVEDKCIIEAEVTVLGFKTAL